MFKPPYAEDRTYGGVRGSGETIVSHSLLDYIAPLPPYTNFMLLSLKDTNLFISETRGYLATKKNYYDAD